MYVVRILKSQFCAAPSAVLGGRRERTLEYSSARTATESVFGWFGEGLRRATSQTKPGPNIAAAVDRKVWRNVSMEEKERVRGALRPDGMATGSGKGDYW